ncbi:hypothetical protein [Paraburkholderia bryophila]|uniref:TnsA endonuclease-like protein n=1 Tax=Paraburkholderia bryophila TaxID=420952 RepID=A0A7Y9W5X1_9BURK|nr:hypothetical protein [Paraburkholderia bryophila]NYH14308.1 hypothetical protein [Paraburkholderia bryophila]
MIQPRFVRAVNNIRPYGAHRYDLFGPKIGRQLTLFGRLALDLWVRLESDPRVVSYCERPVCIPDAKPSRVVEFWVRTHDEERLCVVLRSAESASVERGGSLFPAFQSWSRSSSLQLQMIHPRELDDPQVLRENRIMMLCYLAGTHALPVKELMSGVLTVCKNGTTLAELEQQFATADPTLVRSAVFRLVLRGEVRCAALAFEPLGPNTKLVLL